MTDCADPSDDDDEFGNTVDGLRGTRLILTDPEPKLATDGVRGML